MHLSCIARMGHAPDCTRAKSLLFETPRLIMCDLQQPHNLQQDLVQPVQQPLVMGKQSLHRRSTIVTQKTPMQDTLIASVALIS